MGLKYVDSGRVLVGWSNKMAQGESTRCVISSCKHIPRRQVFMSEESLCC